MATIAGILTLISSLAPMEQNQLKTILLNESPKISGIEQLIANERFTSGLVCPLCGCIGHVSRNGHNITNCKGAKGLGVEVKFEKRKYRNNVWDGELMLAVLSSFAQEESKSVSDNLKWRFKKKFEQGELVINTKRFLEYDKNKYGQLVINQNEAKIVRRIFDEYLSGKGILKITKEFNNEKIPTVSDGRWHDSTINQILKNEKYKGAALLQKYYTPGHL